MADFKNIPVDKDTTADEVLQRLLCKLGDEVNIRNSTEGILPYGQTLVILKIKCVGVYHKVDS